MYVGNGNADVILGLLWRSTLHVSLMLIFFLLFAVQVWPQPLDLDQHTALMNTYDGLGANRSASHTELTCPG